MPWIIAALVLGLYCFWQPGSFSAFTVNDLVLAAPVSATVDTVMIPQKSIPVRSEAAAPNIAAASYAAYDESSGFAVLNERSNDVRSIASITKLMTVLVFLDHNPDWTKEITITRADYREGGRIHLYPGDTVTVGDLFRTGLIASDNVAIAALVRSTGLSESAFVAEMNLKAQNLRMKQTSFTDPTGLHNGNRSSARDVARLAQAAFDTDVIKDTVTRTSYTFTTKEGKRKDVVSTDKLLEADMQDGITLIAGKTGYLESAGFCFVGRFEKEGHTITTVVLGAETEAARFEETKKVAEWVYNSYRW